MSKLCHLRSFVKNNAGLSRITPNFAIAGIHFMHKAEPKFPLHLIERFCVVGVNYLQATAVERSLFAITPENHENLLLNAKLQGFRSMFALSTCNRTELYGYCQSETELTDCFLKYTDGTKELFTKFGFSKKGNDALEYLFNVAAGLNSQITGDYEIVSQLKSAVELSRKHDLIGPIMDRTINYAMQASKSVKTNTNLSNGTVSVSYAVIEWLTKTENINEKSVLLLGAGNLGKNVLKNLQHYLKLRKITVINRTDAIALAISKETKTEYKPFADLSTEADEADIIIVCTNSCGYTLMPAFFTESKTRQVFDLSVPENVHPDVKNISGINVTGIDEVSKTLQETFAKRKAEIPKANMIIADFLHQFKIWLSMYRHVPAINSMKVQLQSLSAEHFSAASHDSSLDIRINKTVGALAANLRAREEKGCQYISAMNDFLNEGVLHD